MNTTSTNTLDVPAGLTTEDVSNITKYANDLAEANEQHERVISIVAVLIPSDNPALMAHGVMPEAFRDVFVQASIGFLVAANMVQGGECDCPACQMQRAATTAPVQPQPTPRPSFWDRVFKGKN